MFTSKTLKTRERKTRLHIDTLEARDVPSITLVSTELRITCSTGDDVVKVSIDDKGTSSIADDMVVATRTSSIASQNLTRSIPLTSVRSIRVSLSNGNNSFENDTSLRSIVTGGTGNDTMIGGSGNDSFYGYGGNDSLSGGAGNDLLYGSTGNDTLIGNEGTDSLYGEAGQDKIFGLAPAVSMAVADGNNILSGGDDNDSVYGAGGKDSIYGGNGNDLLSSGTGDDKIYGDAGNDTVFASDGNDYVDGGLGNDVVYAGDDNDSLFGGAGNDQLYGQDGNDSINGSTGNDRLDGGEGNDTLSGGFGNDSLLGQAGNDTLRGDTEKDWLVGGLGNDLMYGGTGIDTIVGVDGDSDIAFGGNSASNLERDELWMDSDDAITSLVGINSAKAVDPRAVHIVANFRSYTVSGVNQSPGIAPNIANLADPTREAGDTGVKENFKTHPLFGPNGPKYSDIDQGAVGSCYFLARLASMSKTNPQFIKDMIVDLGDGTYAVQMFDEDNNRVFVRVDADLWVNSTGTPLYTNVTSEGAIWVALVEKAWAIHRYGTGSYGDINGGNSEVNTSTALGLNQIKSATENYVNGLAYVNAIRAQLALGRGVMIGAPSGLNDYISLTPSNYRTGAHIFMVHSVVTNAAGVPIKLNLYNLYGGALTEITDFDVLHYCSSGLTAVWRK
jgi:Ca2+-binding RTX toxin-like protein